MFKELITQLDKVKTEKDLTYTILDHFTSGAVAANMMLVERENPELSNRDVLEVARMNILTHFDNYLLSLFEQENQIDSNNQEE